MKNCGCCDNGCVCAGHSLDGVEQHCILHRGMMSIKRKRPLRWKKEETLIPEEPVIGVAIDQPAIEAGHIPQFKLLDIETDRIPCGFIIF